MTRSRRHPLVAWTALVAAVALAWLAAGGPPRAGALEEDPPDEESSRGDTLYTTHCARCHGADGRGGADDLAPRLRGVPAAEVDLVLRTGRMPPANPDGSGRGMDWDDDDRETLLAHMTAVFDLEGPILDPEPGDPARGREVFATHCAACHGYAADGGVAGAGDLTPRLVGLDPVVIGQSIRVGPFQMPRFAEEQISDDELGDIVAYINEVAEEETTLIGLGELNPVFLSAFVALLAIAMLFSCMWIAGRVTMFPDPDPDPAETGGSGAEEDQR